MCFGFLALSLEERGFDGSHKRCPLGDLQPLGFATFCYEPKAPTAVSIELHCEESWPLESLEAEPGLKQ